MKFKLAINFEMGGERVDKFNIDELLQKKAMGYMVEEVSVDYERAKVKGALFCKSKNRLYLRNGFIKVQIIDGQIIFNDSFFAIKFTAPKKKSEIKKFKRLKVAKS